MSHCTQVSALNCPSKRWLKENINVLQTNGSTAAEVLSRERDNVATVREILKYMEQLGNRQLAGDPSTGGYWPCEKTRDLEDRVNTADNIMRHQGFSLLYQCLSIIGEDMEGQDQSKQSKALFEAIDKFSKDLKELAATILSKYGLSWKYPQTLEVLNYTVPDTYRVCNLTKMLSFREKQRWSITAQYSNESVLKYIRSGRGTFNEAIELDSTFQKLRSVQMTTPSCNSSGYHGQNYGTAIMNTFQGRASTSHFSFTPLADNAAIQAALQRGEHEKELVQDSDTRSNDALVIIPALLALVPLGLFQDASFFLAVVYIIATDVISVMPLLIKGIELTNYGSKKHYSSTSYFYGGLNAKDFAVAETWSAVCSMRPFVRTKGLVFIFVALFTILVGIFLELLARYYLERYKSMTVNDALLDQSGIAMPSENAGGLFWHMKRARALMLLTGR